MIIFYCSLIFYHSYLNSVCFLKHISLSPNDPPRSVFCIDRTSSEVNLILVLANSMNFEMSVGKTGSSVIGSINCLNVLTSSLVSRVNFVFDGLVAL